MLGSNVAALRIAHYEVTDALQRHFERSDDYLNVQQLSDMTGLDTTEVQNALRVLYEQGIITAIRRAGSPYPTEVTGFS
jgi:predicted transcriptional regulator